MENYTEAAKKLFKTVNHSLQEKAVNPEILLLAACAAALISISEKLPPANDIEDI